MVSKGKNIKYSHTYNEEFSSANLFFRTGRKSHSCSKNTYRHPNILNTMMMLQNIEQMKVELNSFIYTFILHMYLMKSRFLVG